MHTDGFCMPNEMQLCAKMPPTHMHERAATFKREWLAAEVNGRGSGSRVIFLATSGKKKKRIKYVPRQINDRVIGIFSSGQ